MATFTITAANTNIDSLAGKAGGDTYNINGGELIIDQDSRYGANQSTSSTLGPITISATLGGLCLIDSSNVRLIPYNSGSGNVPAYNTSIVQGGVSGKLIGVISALTAAPTAPGAAMPATGFIKVKQKAGGNYAAGALTNIGASATGADIQGFIEVVGDEAGTATVPRLGQFATNGGKFDLGTTSGAANQQLQLPTFGLSQYIAGIWIEESPGSNNYEFYPNAGSQTAVATDIRGKVVWISTAGLCRIGHNGTANAGYVPAAGCKIFAASTNLQNATTAARTANALPNATLATRYDFTTSGAGAIDMQYTNMAWYPIFAQAYSVVFTHVGVLESINISEIATTPSFNYSGVGQTAAQTQVALVAAFCFFGINIQACAFSRATLASTGAYTCTLTDCDNVNIAQSTRFMGLALKGNATSGNILATRVNNLTTDNLILINGRAVFATCDTGTLLATRYVDVITGTTNSTAVQTSYVFEVNAATKNYKFDIVTFHGLTNVHPYLGILLISTAKCSNIILRNIGDRTTPLSFGSANASAFAIVAATGSAASNVRVQRVYVTLTRSGFCSVDNSTSGFIVENCSGDYADNSGITALNAYIKGLGSTQTLGASASVYGSHFQDFFTSATVGRIGITMNEPTSVTADLITLGNNAKFTGAGGLYMPTVGMVATFEMDYAALGHEGFANSAAVMAGGTIANYRFRYQIAQGDNGAFSAWSAQLTAAALGTALNGETLDPSLGVKLKIEIETTTANATAITSLYLITSTSTASQTDYQYALDPPITLQFDNYIAGSDIVILEAGTETERINASDVMDSFYQYTFPAAQAGVPVDICIYSPGSEPYIIRNYPLPSADASLLVAQKYDRFYID